MTPKKLKCLVVPFTSNMVDQEALFENLSTAGFQQDEGSEFCIYLANYTLIWRNYENIKKRRILLRVFEYSDLGAQKTWYNDTDM